MADYAALEQTLTDTLHLTRRPVAVAFRESAPDDVARLEGTRPSGCTFWGMAADGRVFYTVPADHYNCPIGSYTHNIPLPPEREQEFSGTLALMDEIGYLRMEEVSGGPRLAATPQVTVYAPLALTPVPPDVVILSGTPAGLMLLHEAATRAGRPAVPLLGRPTCTAIPAAMASGIASSLGCVGNRVYTGLSDESFYSVVRGDTLAVLMNEINTLIAANVMLSEYHRDRLVTLTA